MRLGNVIEGLTIFRKYFTGEDGYHLTAVDSAVLVYGTDTPMSDEDVEAVKELGWFQPDAQRPEGVDQRDAPYDPNEYWKAWL